MTLRLQPVSQTRIINLWLAVPELRFQLAMNVKVAQQQLDAGMSRRKIAAHILRAYMDSKKPAVSASRLDDHGTDSLERMSC